MRKNISSHFCLLAISLSAWACHASKGDSPLATTSGALNGTDAPSNAEGPGPIDNGGVKLANGNLVSGAVHTVITHPTNPDRLVIGTVNGGIWTTTSLTANQPSWVPRINTKRSQAVAAMDSDPARRDSLLAGFGIVSSYPTITGVKAGLLRSDNFGDNWSEVEVDASSSAQVVGRNIRGVALRGDVMLVADISPPAGEVGLLRSDDAGQNFSLVSSLPAGPVTDLAGDPSDPERLYVAILGEGVFTSDDTGGSWQAASGPEVCPGTPPCLENGLFETLTNSALDRSKMTTDLAVGREGRVAVVGIVGGQPWYFGYSDDHGQTWTRMDLPRLTLGLANPVVDTTGLGVPIVFTTANPHGLADGARIHVEGILGNTAANGDFRIAVVADDQVEVTECLTYPGCDGRGSGPYEASFGTLVPYRDTHQGASGHREHLSIAVDPEDQTVVYLGGDQIGPLGNLWRGHTDVTPTSRPPGDGPGPNGRVPSPQWKHLGRDNIDGDVGTPPELLGGGTLSGTYPHADSRDIAFDLNHDLIEVDDGGIFLRTNPRTNFGNWFSRNGDLQITELHSLAYDSVSKVLFGGTQDNGNVHAAAPAGEPGAVNWFAVTGADGTQTAVDVKTYAAQKYSLRFITTQIFGTRKRCLFDEQGKPVNDISGSNCNTMRLGMRCADVATCSNSGVPCDVAACTANPAGPGCACQEATATCEICDGSVFPQDPLPKLESFQVAFALNQGSQRMVVLANNGAYESPNGGDTLWALRQLPLGGATVGALAGDSDYDAPIVYGHPDDNELLYIGSYDKFWVRTTAKPTLDKAVKSPGGARIRGLDVSPTDPDVVFAVVDGDVFMKTDASDISATAMNWTSLTGDLLDARQPVKAGTLWDVKFIPGATASNPDRLFVGSTSGIFVMAMNAPGFWNHLNPSDAPDGLPNALIKDLIWDADGKRLFVGSFGRGAWSIAQPGAINLPPAARCEPNVPVTADQMCQASLTAADVDAGSVDPEGANLNPTIDLSGPLPFGTGDVTLTVSDESHTESCTTQYVVVDETPPVFVEQALAPVVIPSCDFSGQDVLLDFPAAIDNCSPEAEVEVIGMVMASTNPAFPPGALLTDPDAPVPAGTYTIQWIAVDAVGNQTIGEANVRTQTVSVQPALFAGQTVEVKSGSAVRIAGSQTLGGVANAGGGTTTIGNDAYVGDITSVASVTLGDRSIAGDVVSAGQITLGSNAQVASQQAGATISLPDRLDLDGITPPTGGATATLGASPLAPGAYGSTTVSSGQILTLGAGVYRFAALTLNSQAIVTATDDTVLYVGTSQQWQSSFRTASGRLAHVTAGYFGSTLQMSADFAGTLIAPNATVRMGTSNAQAFSGVIHAATIVLENGADFTCDPALCSTTACGGPPDTCSNQQMDGDEEGTDCGGSCPDECEGECTSVTYEAENMASSTGGAYPPAGGSGPPSWNLWGNGYLSTQHDFPPGPAQITVRALGEQALNVLPHLVVSIDGVAIGDATVTTGGFADYTFAFMAASGEHEVRVTFDNDLYQPPADRNLVVDSVSVNCAPVFRMTNGSVSMEAEHFHGATQNGSSDRWSRQSVSQASGAAGMSIGPDSGNVWTSNVQSSSPRLDFNVNFDTSGTFYLHVRADGPNGSGDSCWGGADAGLNATYYDFADNPNTWGWISRTLPITMPGLHTVQVWAREDGLNVDKLVINTSSTPPSGAGPAESVQD